MIGAGIVTCNRPDFFLKCFRSIPKGVELVVVNDGSNFEDWQKLLKEKPFEYIHNEQNIGVGKSKNKLLKRLIEKSCTDIFLIEDDIVVRDSKVFEEYIRAKDITGIQHFNFGYHGPANKDGISGGAPKPRYIIDYGDIKIAFNRHSVGAFCYYTRALLDKAGLFDEDYTNAFEHVDHDYRCFKAKMSTPYWHFADIANSTDYLDEIQCSEASSAIRPRADWQENIKTGVMLFKKKHGYLPAWQGAVPDTYEKQMKRILKDLQRFYAKRD